MTTNYERIKNMTVEEMADKIIIDGVDVSECLYRELRNAAYGKKYNHCKRFPNGCCSKNKNCYYKQLKRTQNQYNAVVEQNKSLQQELKRKEEECEELKRDIETGIMCIQCERELENCKLQAELQAEKEKVKELEEENGRNKFQ